MDYQRIRLLHQIVVTVSVGGFVARSLAVRRHPGWVRSRGVRVAAQSVDTLLLALGLTLAWRLQLDPLTTGWLQAKLAGLACYVAFGMVALRPGRSTPVWLAATLAALASVAYIIAVAITKDPLLRALLR